MPRRAASSRQPPAAARCVFCGAFAASQPAASRQPVADSCRESAVYLSSRFLLFLLLSLLLLLLLRRVRLTSLSLSPSLTVVSISRGRCVSSPQQRDASREKSQESIGDRKDRKRFILARARRPSSRHQLRAPAHQSATSGVGRKVNHHPHHHHPRRARPKRAAQAELLLLHLQLCAAEKGQNHIILEREISTISAAFQLNSFSDLPRHTLTTINRRRQFFLRKKSKHEISSTPDVCVRPSMMQSSNDRAPLETQQQQ